MHRLEPDATIIEKFYLAVSEKVLLNSNQESSRRRKPRRQFKEGKPRDLIEMSQAGQD